MFLADLQGREEKLDIFKNEIDVDFLQWIEGFDSEAGGAEGMRLCRDIYYVLRVNT